MENLEAQINSELLEGFCRNWNIREFSLFGSVLGEKFNNASDIDVMVSFGFLKICSGFSQKVGPISVDRNVLAVIVFLLTKSGF